MCRLLCYMGEAIPMEMLITKPEHSLVFQSRDASFHPGCLDKRNIRVNGDGFGIAWYNSKRIDEGSCLVRFATPAWSSPNLLNIAKFVESGLVFAHVRAASDGTVLVGNVNHENTHPFKCKRYTFMHNGGIPGFDAIKRQLLSLIGDEAYRSIEGTTDSEVCFAFFLDELPSSDERLSAGEIAQVLRRTIARIVSAVARFAAVDPSTPTAAAATAAATAPAVPAMSLNFCVTDGRHIVCSRYRNHPRQAPPSLFVLSGAGFACDKEGSCLRLTGTDPHSSVVISSEPLCRSTKSWQLIPRNSMVIVEGAPPATATSLDRNGEASSGTTVREGLVSFIKFEPLRCHPSDVPEDNSVGRGDKRETCCGATRVGSGAGGDAFTRAAATACAAGKDRGGGGRGEGEGVEGKYVGKGYSPACGSGSSSGGGDDNGSGGGGSSGCFSPPAIPAITSAVRKNSDGGIGSGVGASRGGGNNSDGGDGRRARSVAAQGGSRGEGVFGDEPALLAVAATTTAAPCSVAKEVGDLLAISGEEAVMATEQADTAVATAGSGVCARGVLVVDRGVRVAGSGGTE